MSSFDFPGIERLIKQKESDINKRVSQGIHEHLNFKRLLASLSTYRDKHPISGYVSVLISPSDIENLTQVNLNGLYDGIDYCILNSKNHLIIDKDYNLKHSERIHHSDSNTLRRVYQELSREYCVIVLNATFIHYFINGDDVGNAIFFTKEDQERFNERKEITELNSLFEEYRRVLQNRYVYQNFFVSNSGKRSLYRHLTKSGELPLVQGEEAQRKAEKDFLKKYKNLLENKPEDRFRENLRKYLEEKLKGTVYITKELILESFKRIDIFINDEFGELYLIEVKWVGRSIHASGTKIGQEFKAGDITPAAVIQSINYISELYRNKKDIKIGYLVVFDARDEDLEDTLSNFDSSVLKTENLNFYSRFNKIKDFKIQNLHPN